MEEVEPCTGHLEHVVGIEVARERTTAQEAQRQLGVTAIRCSAAPRAAVNDRPRACDDRRDVARKRAGCREIMAHRTRVVHDLGGALNSIGGDDPAGGSDHVKRPLGLHVRLVHAGPRTVSVIGLELGVEVDLTVLGIGVAVQALAAARVTRQGTNLEGDRLPHR